jgi:carbamoyl-phosphate synthase large subunit
MNRHPRRALVLGVGGVVGLGIIEALRLAEKSYWIEAACVSPESPGHLLADAAQLSPYASDSNFVEWLTDVCEKRSIDVVLSGQEDVLEVLAAHKESPGYDEAADAVMGVDALERLKLSRDKLRLSEWLNRQPFPTPSTIGCTDSEAVQDFLTHHPPPWVVKPRFGRGSRGMFTTDEPDRVLSLAGSDEMVVQTYVETDRHEQTVACLCGPDSTLVGSVAFDRVLRDGNTVWARPLPHETPARSLAQEICTRLRVTGPCNLQFRIGTDGVPRLLDVNLRFSSTVGLRALAGFNDVATAVDYWLADPSPQVLVDPQDGVAVRYLVTKWVPQGLHDALARGGRIEPGGPAP